MNTTRRDAYTLLEDRGLPPSVARRITDGFFRLIAEALASGRGVRLKNFAAFDVRDRAPARMRNNRTGQEMLIPARKAVKARFSKNLRSLLNADRKTPEERQP